MAKVRKVRHFGGTPTNVVIGILGVEVVVDVQVAVRVEVDVHNLAIAGRTDTAR